MNLSKLRRISGNTLALKGLTPAILPDPENSDKNHPYSSHPHLKPFTPSPSLNQMETELSEGELDESRPIPPSRDETPVTPFARAGWNGASSELEARGQQHWVSTIS